MIVRRVVNGLLVLSLASGLVFAIPYEWTPEEIACAATLGIELKSNYDSPSTTPSALAWISDVVVRGVVTEIRSNLEGKYHTLVTVAVSETFKGSPGSTVTVRLISGPTFSDADGKFGHLSVSTEPVFSVSEDVLLFLTDDYTVLPGADPLLYAHGSNEFTVVVKGKYHVVASGDQLINAKYPLEALPLNQTIGKIQNAVSLQASNCG